jgi:hypothetical protein
MQTAVRRQVINCVISCAVGLGPQDKHSKNVSPSHSPHFRNMSQASLKEIEQPKRDRPRLEKAVTNLLQNLLLLHFRWRAGHKILVSHFGASRTPIWDSILLCCTRRSTTRYGHVRTIEQLSRASMVVTSTDLNIALSTASYPNSSASTAFPRPGMKGASRQEPPRCNHT